MKKDVNVIIGAAVSPRAKAKFEKLCTRCGTDTSKMLRAFIELAVSGSFIKHAEKMRQAAKLIESFSVSMDALILETVEQTKKRKRSK